MTPAEGESVEQPVLGEVGTASVETESAQTSQETPAEEISEADEGESEVSEKEEVAVIVQPAQPEYSTPQEANRRYAILARK